MKSKYKRYIWLNLSSIFFIIVSLSSVTLAWFAYSGMSSTKMDIDVRAWYIELTRDGKPATNDFIVALNDVYPGMETVSETMKIKNLGDSDANVRYSIVSSRILEDEKITDENTTSSSIEDELSHNYPFHINMNLSKEYALTNGGESLFTVSISWPLDSLDNEADSRWGMSSYEFQKTEDQKARDDETYSKRPAIQVVISVVAEQYVDGDEASDPRYDLGKEILYDLETHKECETLGNTCISTTVVSVNNHQSEDVLLLPSLDNTFISGNYINYQSVTTGNSWHINNSDVKTNIRSLTINDILNIITTDIVDSKIIRPHISDQVIGTLSMTTRMDSVADGVAANSGYFQFKNSLFSYLNSINCIWLNNDYDILNSYAIKNENENTSKLYGEIKENSCLFIPVLVLDKNEEIQN